MASISVFVRIRPMLQTEIDSNQQREKRFSIGPSKKQISVQISDKRQKVFNFNRIFDQSTSQQQIYNGLDLNSMINKVLDGYHSTIFAYGQTGSGKTFTIQGQQQNPGLISRSLDQLFGLIQQRNNNERAYKVMLSFVQIYNEGIFDLIDATGKPLKMRWNKHQQFIVQNLFQVQCRNKQDALKWWKKGQKNKIMGSHKMNINSSRSHCLFTLKVSSYDLQDPSNIIQSKFQIVDLAGSQRQKVTKSSGAVFRQGIQINKSLFTLRQVISALYEISQGQNPNKHIPYRDSKLTSLLKQSIGGNTYCSMIACLNPTSTHFEQSLQTLTYASMAAFINNVPSKNIDPKIKQNELLRQQNQQYRKQIKKMAQHIQELSRLLQSGMCASCKNNQNKGLGLRRSVTQTNPLKEQQEINEPSGIIKLPRFQNRNTIDPNQKIQSDNQKTKYQSQKSINAVPTTQKKTLKTNKDILESITMIKQLINANSGLREKIQALKSINQKQQKQIYGLIKQNQVLRDRWDMMNDAIVQNENQKSAYNDEAPIAMYERLIEQQRGISGSSFYKPNRITSQNSHIMKSSMKPTSYNQFLKMSAKNDQAKVRKKKNLSMYHRQTGRSDFLV